MKKAMALLLLFVTIGFCAVSCNSKTNSETVVPIDEAWLKENLQYVTLELYYISPGILTRAPWGVDDLMRSCDIHVTACGGAIQEHMDLLCQVLDVPPAPVDNPDEVHLNARAYYTICGKNGEVLFEVAMWGLEEDGSIFVNGVPCAENPIFYDVLMKFLPENAAREFQTYMQDRGTVLRRQGDGSSVWPKSE